MSRKAKLTFILAIIAVVLFVVAFIRPLRKPLNVVCGWGDNSGGRKSYTQEEIENGALDEVIVFNSISNGVIGDEKNFVGARLDNGINLGENNIWNGNEITVQNGDVYLVRAYVHNNSTRKDGGISQNTKVAFNIPGESATSIPVHGFIFSDNATPSEYWDGVLFKSENKFHLEYIYGSALLENRGVGAGGLSLGDEIVTKAASNNGTLIGYDALDGNIAGGYPYACYVSIKVMVVFDSDYIVEHMVRLTDGGEWGTTVAAQIGDEVEFQIQYQNTGESIQKNVMVRDVLAKSLEYVPGSTRLYNISYQKGAVVNQDDLVTETGINIGHYAPGANVYIRFRAKVLGDNLQIGSNTLVSWSRCSVGGIVLQDFASVTIKKTE